MLKALYGERHPIFQKDIDMVDIHLNHVLLNIPNIATPSHTENVARFLGLSMVVFNALWYCYCHPWYNLIAFMSNIVILTTILQLSLSLYLSNYKLKTRLHLLSTYHLLTEVNCGLHICVLLVYWIVLRKSIFAEHWGNWKNMLCTCVTHTFPQLAYILDTLVTERRLVAWHAPYIYIPVTVVYGAINYFFTVYVRDRPVYFFMPWTDYKSAAVIMGLCVVFSCIYAVVAKV